MKLTNHVVLGLYSDPSAFTIEAAILETDGLDISKVFATLSRPYPHDLHEELLKYTGQNHIPPKTFNKINQLVSQFFIQVAQEIITEVAPQNLHIDFIGLSGHSAVHQPESKAHINFGDAQIIADALQIPVIHHFVKEDLNAGGVGTPLLTTFWDALCRKLEKPLAIITLGGVSRLVYLGPMGELIGFDIGAGLTLLDRWIQRRTGQEMDFNGNLGAQGTPEPRVLKKLLNMPYLLKKPPKSVQRTDFQDIAEQLEALSPADGAATLTAFIAQCIAQSQNFLPLPPTQWICIGGGIANPTLMLQLAQLLPNVKTAQQVLPYTNELNAMGFAFIASRYQQKLPITFPSTTGVLEPISGGKITYPGKS